MIILDTDTLSIAQHPEAPAALALRRRLVTLPDDAFIGTTIISYEEQTRGWFAYVAKARKPAQRIEAYARLMKHLQNWRESNVIPFDEPAESEYARLAGLKLKLGQSDLKIAAITLSRNALLLSRNLQHFNRVPGLKVADWTKL